MPDVGEPEAAGYWKRRCEPRRQLGSKTSNSLQCYHLFPFVPWLCLQTRRRTSRKETMLPVSKGNCSRRVIASCAKRPRCVRSHTCLKQREFIRGVVLQCVLCHLCINARKVNREITRISFCVKDYFNIRLRNEVSHLAVPWWLLLSTHPLIMCCSTSMLLYSWYKPINNIVLVQKAKSDLCIPFCLNAFNHCSSFQECVSVSGFS